MKKYIKFFYVALLSLAFFSCEDDEAISAGDGDPLGETVATVDITVTTIAKAGEGDRIPVTVSLGQSFASDVAVGIRATLDNGNQTQGSVTVPAGSTSATGSVVLPADDGFDSGTFEGESDYGTLTAFAILLDELEPNTSYVTNSTDASFDLLDLTLDVDGGLNVLFDWANPDINDLDMFIFDYDTFTQWEGAASGDRYEQDLFQTPGRPDGDYFIAVDVWIATDSSIPWRFMLTRPDGFVDVYEGTFENPSGLIFPVVEFTKTTDEVSGEITYTTNLPD